MKQRMIAGDHYPLGAQWDGEGVNFALFSANAEKVELCLFDESGETEIARHMLPEQKHNVWHGYLSGLAPGTVYGYRVYGNYNPSAGDRFNHHKLLLDPYARQLRGQFIWHASHFGYDPDSPELDLSFNTQDNAAYMQKAVVTAPWPQHQDRPKKPATPWNKTSIYESHVRGFTIRHPQVPELQQGTFAGMGHAKVIDYIKALGVSSVELMPVHAFIDEDFLTKKGLKNYWGYNSLNFFTPHAPYLSDDNIFEFRQMVDRYHDAGIEVILDVVYNHSCESNHLGPTLSFRGIDNASYYRLQAEQPRYYVNDTGCGNTLKVSHPRVMQLVMDSLRYWSTEMGVDGFRFDLAPIAGRDAKGFDPQASFFQTLSQDPQLAKVKLIAEPWDIGPGGYQLGHFPSRWSEWNDNYRDTVRQFWRRDPGQLPTFARRLHGSSDIFEHGRRRPTASINYLASHDGFTLNDLVSYQNRHNLANGEDNRDGHRENLSENFGVEGDSENPEILAARRRQQRNMLATLMLSQGVPMFTAGDEMLRSQQGNNNAYCQDNELNWLDWEHIQHSSYSKNHQQFVRRLLEIRNQHPVLTHDNYIHSPAPKGSPSIHWLSSDGTEMRDEHWQEHHNYFLGYQLKDPNKGTLLAIFNNGRERPFMLPKNLSNQSWQWLINTAEESGFASNNDVSGKTDILIAGRSVAVLSSIKEN